VVRRWLLITSDKGPEFDQVSQRCDPDTLRQALAHPIERESATSS
jgi:hypothetical protein